MAILTTRFSAKLTVIVGVTLVVFAAAMYFGPQIRFYSNMRRYAPDRWWRETPRPLVDTSVSTAPGKTVSCFGYKFEVPWTNVVRERKDDEDRLFRILFNTGAEVFFWDPAYSQSDSLPGYSGSKYEHLKSVLSITISSLSPFLSHQGFARQRDEVEEKGMMLEHSGATDIFGLETPGYRGFEVSGLSYSGRVGIGLFDNADHQFLIEVRQMPGVPITTTQQDINRLIRSFGPIGEQSWAQNPIPRGRFGLYR